MTRPTKKYTLTIQYSDQKDLIKKIEELYEWFVQDKLEHISRSNKPCNCCGKSPCQEVG